MAEKINATCSICGKGYHKCLSCKDKIKAEPWKMYTDTPEHYKIFQVMRGLYVGLYTKEEAKDRLKNIDLSDLNELRDNIKNTIEEIMKEDEKVSKVEEPVDVTEPPVVETEVVKPSYVSRRKKHHVVWPVDEIKAE